jgi:hypothetical protein
MPRRLYRPSRAQILWLAAVASVAIAGGYFLRYRIIEASTVGLACDAALRAGSQTLTCEIRRVATLMFNNSVFSYVALAAAVLNLVRPSIVLMSVGLFAGGAGVVLYNAGLSGFALALLILSLARPAPEPE